MEVTVHLIGMVFGNDILLQRGIGINGAQKLEVEKQILVAVSVFVTFGYVVAPAFIVAYLYAEKVGNGIDVALDCTQRTVLASTQPHRPVHLIDKLRGRNIFPGVELVDYNS
jgi:hypothetical protein